MYCMALHITTLGNKLKKFVRYSHAQRMLLNKIYYNYLHVMFVVVCPEV